MTPDRPSYRSVDHWRRYQSFLPDWLRFSPDSPPIEEWWSWRGAEIHLDRHPVAGAPLTVVLLHGAGGYGRLFVSFAQLFQRQGYEVVSPDLPGYGLSRSPDRLTSHDQWVELVVDLVRAEKARKRHPVVLLGCSLGGYLAYLAAARGQDVAGIIATTLADPRLPLVRRQFTRHPLLAWLAPVVLPWFDALGGSLRIPIRWVSNMAAISNDPRLTEVFVSDKCGGGNRVPVHFMRSLLEAAPALEPEQFDLCPVLLVHPAADRWTTVEASRLFFDRIKGTKRIVLLENCGHFPIEEPGLTRLREATAEFLDDIHRGPGRACG